MSSKKVDLSHVGPGRSNVDRNEEMKAIPSSGSATPKHKLSASQSNGAGSAWKNAGASVNGMAVIMPGGAGHSEPSGTSTNERASTPTSKTPDARVQAAKKKRTDSEKGTYDRTGGQDE
jgi:hypothetical protein